MHLAQAFTLWPEAKVAHWRLGCFLVLLVGLYLLISFFLLPVILPRFWQIWQILLIFFIMLSKK
jgi:hypothetical protein